METNNELDELLDQAYSGILEGSLGDSLDLPGCDTGYIDHNYPGALSVRIATLSGRKYLLSVNDVTPNKG